MSGDPKRTDPDEPVTEPDPEADRFGDKGGLAEEADRGEDTGISEG